MGKNALKQKKKKNHNFPHEANLRALLNYADFAGCNVNNLIAMSKDGQGTSTLNLLPEPGRDAMGVRAIRETEAIRFSI